MACFKQVLAALPVRESAERFPGLPAVFSRAWLVLSLTMLGEFVEGRAVGTAAVQIAKAHEEPYNLITAYAGLGTLYLIQGHLAHAIPILECGFELSRLWNLQSWYHPVASALGYGYALCGRVTDALPLLEHVMERNIATKSMCNQALRVAWLSEAYLFAGRLEAALQTAIQALHLSHIHKERGNQASALRLLGEVYAHREPREAEQAEDYYQQALALATTLGMRPLLAHCHLGLGTLYRKCGQRQQAQTALSAAIELYRTLQMPWWLARAEAALR